MALWDIVSGRDSNLEDALLTARELSKMSISEEQNLELHSKLCAQRFATLVTLIHAGLDNSRQNKTLLLILFATLILTKVLTVDMIGAALKALF